MRQRKSHVGNTLRVANLKYCTVKSPQELSKLLQIVFASHTIARATFRPREKPLHVRNTANSKHDTLIVNSDRRKRPNAKHCTPLQAGANTGLLCPRICQDGPFTGRRIRVGSLMDASQGWVLPKDTSPHRICAVRSGKKAAAWSLRLFVKLLAFPSVLMSQRQQQ